MSCRKVDLIGDVATAVMWLLVGLPGLSSQLSGELSAPWWACYGTAGVTLVLIQVPPVPVRVSRVLLVPLGAATIAMFLLAPGYPLAPLPMVVFAMVVAWLRPLSWSFAVIAGLVTLLAVTSLGREESLINLMVVVLYAAWMVFATLLVDGQLRVRRVNGRLEEANAELARAHVRLAESSRAEERLRISRDLHDLVGHQLTALAVNLEVAAHLTDGPAAEPVEQSRVLAKELLRDVRDVVGRLRETVPDLRAALQDMALAVPQPQVHVSVGADLPAVSDERRETLLRCAQEAITNAMRHADAQHLWISVDGVAGETVLTVRDDGRRIGAVAPGNGLAGMQERLAALGGRLSYAGGSGDGFRLEAHLPAAG